MVDAVKDIFPSIFGQSMRTGDILVKDRMLHFAVVFWIPAFAHARQLKDFLFTPKGFHKSAQGQR